MLPKEEARRFCLNPLGLDRPAHLGRTGHKETTCWLAVAKGNCQAMPSTAAIVNLRLLTIHHNGVLYSMTEKRKPTYDLAAFKAAFADEDRINVTGTALRTAASLGFGRAEIVATIQMMRRPHFYKSMTSYGDHRVWQDVYHVPSEAGVLYVKFTADIVSEFLLLSFKEKDHD